MAGNSVQVRQHRSIVMGHGGMIATAHPLASAAGLQILRAGGNAADAALAAAAVTGVTICGTNSMGGDMFCLYYDAATHTLTGFNGSGGAPAAATIEEMRRRGHRHMPARGPLTVTVPGAVDGYCELHKRFATMPLTRLFGEAIRYAEEGHPVAARTSSAIATQAQELTVEDEWKRVYTPAGRAPMPGEILKQPDLGWTLRQVAEGGRNAFYEGEVGRRIVAGLQQRDGLLTEADLRPHQTEVYTPISSSYRGLAIHETCPP
ncbi:MAG: gamma-glutamyltransferase, partial [Dehalococcoidia bacterium]